MSFLLSYRCTSVFRYLLKLDVILKARRYAARMSREKHVCKVVQVLFQRLSELSSYALIFCFVQNEKNVPSNVA